MVSSHLSHRRAILSRPIVCRPPPPPPPPPPPTPPATCPPDFLDGVIDASNHPWCWAGTKHWAYHAPRTGPEAGPWYYYQEEPLGTNYFIFEATMIGPPTNTLAVTVRVWELFVDCQVNEKHAFAFTWCNHQSFFLNTWDYAWEGATIVTATVTW